MKLWLDKLIPFFLKFRETPNQSAERAIERHNDRGMITYHADGFMIKLGELPTHVGWKDITAISAYKVDLMTTDEVCICVKIGEDCFVLTESTPGYHYWITQMEEMLEDVNMNWYEQVIAEPFETRHTIIYKRK